VEALRQGLCHQSSDFQRTVTLEEVDALSTLEFQREHLGLSPQGELPGKNGGSRERTLPDFLIGRMRWSAATGC
jgi:hypothetical protein